jgi:LPPG:FO 2-phospho-L-lactate transferase
MKIVALAGGVGGSKLSHGLAQILGPGELTIIVNTGDDFEHLGLTICPDLDTVCYTLAGLSNSDTGWGRAAETFHALESIEKLGGETWFRLGDRDLGTHLERTRRMKQDQPLSEITRTFCNCWGIRHTILPMSDDRVQTAIETETAGELEFQEYFVHQRCEPRIRGFHFRGVEAAQPAPGAIEAIQAADAVVLCPSNPWVSIDPILAVAGYRSALKRKPVIAVSPIIQGKTVRGPAARMFSELGIEPSALAVAEHYQDILSGFVLDDLDAGIEPQIHAIHITTLATNTVMITLEDRRRLAQVVLNLIKRLK